MNTEVKEAPPQFVMTPCQSSRIFSHGHCDRTNTLALVFRTKNGMGGTYFYANFTADDYALFLRAESAGKHFAAHIKDAKHADGTVKYPHTKQ